LYLINYFQKEKKEKGQKERKEKSPPKKESFKILHDPSVEVSQV